MEALLAKVRAYLAEEKIGIIKEAYSFAEAAHSGQVRLSGQPFIEHPVETATFLADLRLDANALAAALLHDVVEDCDIKSEELKEKFGSEISTLVDGVTKLTQTESMPNPMGEGATSRGDESLLQAATLRKMLMAMAEDIRVVLIKLADRLHNMRTLKSLPYYRRVAIARETLEIYAPLAHRLGIWEIKWRLEDLALEHINPQAYREISGLLNSKRDERESYINS